MALTVEDGSQVEDANSYVDRSEADALLSLIGVTVWASLSPQAKEANLARAKLIVDDEATYIYDGERVGLVQNGPWPRVGATYGRSGPIVPSDVIPPEIRRAQIVAAGGIADGRITFGAGAAGPSGLVKSEKVDTLEVTYFSPKETGTAAAAAGNSGPFADLGWPSVTQIVAPLLDIEAYEAAAPAAGEEGGVAADVAARRGPGFTVPSYGGLFDVGQNDTYGRRGLRSPLLSDYS